MHAISDLLLATGTGTSRRVDTTWRLLQTAARTATDDLRPTKVRSVSSNIRIHGLCYNIIVMIISALVTYLVCSSKIRLARINQREPGAICACANMHARGVLHT